jgi:cytidylate kinase
MGIITISRELAALGDETARELVKQFGYRFVDKHSIEERIKSYGIESQTLKKFDERKPSLLASLSSDRDTYLHYLRTAVLAEAEQGDSIFIGRGASAMFKDMPGHIAIFLVAPLAIRLERVKSYFHCDERRARQIIERGDQDRVGFHRYFFDIDWRDPQHYHITINTGIFHPANCGDIVKHLASKVFTQEAEKQKNMRLKELILEQKIKQCIIYEKAIPVHFLEVAISGGIVKLYGVANSQALVTAAANAASETVGSMTVQSEIQVVREYSVIP